MTDLSVVAEDNDGEEVAQETEEGDGEQQVEQVVAGQADWVQAAYSLDCSEQCTASGCFAPHCPSSLPYYLVAYMCPKILKPWVGDLVPILFHELATYLKN